MGTQSTSASRRSIMTMLLCIMTMIASCMVAVNAAPALGRSTMPSTAEAAFTGYVTYIYADGTVKTGSSTVKASARANAELFARDLNEEQHYIVGDCNSMTVTKWTQG